MYIIIVGLLVVCLLVAVLLYLVFKKKETCEPTCEPVLITRKAILMKSNGTIQLTEPTESFLRYTELTGDGGIQFGYTDPTNSTNMLYDLLNNSPLATTMYSEAKQTDVVSVANDILTFSKTDPNFSLNANRAFAGSVHVTESVLKISSDSIVMVDFGQWASVVLRLIGFNVSDTFDTFDTSEPGMLETLQWAGNGQNFPVHLALIGLLGLLTEDVLITGIVWEPFPTTRRNLGMVFNAVDQILYATASELLVTNIISDLPKLMYDSQIGVDDEWPEGTADFIAVQYEKPLWDTLMVQDFSEVAPKLGDIIASIKSSES